MVVLQGGVGADVVDLVLLQSGAGGARTLIEKAVDTLVALAPQATQTGEPNKRHDYSQQAVGELRWVMACLLQADLHLG
ncbi:Hypothetical protein CGLY_16420 (plasmid) [Corynebacterium glyciniphilum AJ 3170]|uniref:Uncharacterized protein n=1 Tax=Corynebacterium glyciniphilum AJ 3170 TaxID=1404245 RepID=X5DYG0_9CORY|nr:hypothetical protein [Corynebacterium glyciniphilum]AHW65657.1 Hypothetical protein CGLY_16420 [Corynebacterium glyciniphilum AJ 3170]